VDTWSWNNEAQEGLEEILSSQRGSYRPQTVELIKGMHKVLKEGSLLAYLINMTRRIAEIHRVLKKTGSFYLHCDPTSSHYLKLVVDSIFCSDGGEFQNEIIWKRTFAHGGSERWGDVHDVLLFYTKSEKYTWNRVLQSHNADYVDDKYRYHDQRGRYRLVVLTGPGVTNGQSGQAWRGYNPTKAGRHWAVPKRALAILAEEGIKIPKAIPHQLEVLFKHGLIRFPQKKNGVPEFKLYLPSGQPIQDLVVDVPPINSQAQERLGYPTQKPEALLERLISSSSREGDVVLDAFCGCGTTIAVAQKLNRKWIGMDITYQSISLVLRRLEQTFGGEVIKTLQLDGAPKDMAAAHALAHKKDDRLRKEFEKWAILTYTGNRAAINSKKGADGGIDGTVYFLTSRTDADKMVFQVKSGAVNRGDIAKFKGDMAREDAALGVFITYEPPTKPMRDEAKAAGLYKNSFMSATYDRVQIVTIQEILEQAKRLSMPLIPEILPSSSPHLPGDQLKLAA
jgi:site-specific DNA-methyltransferase (adenine-specific)